MRRTTILFLLAMTVLVHALEPRSRLVPTIPQQIPTDSTPTDSTPPGFMPTDSVLTDTMPADSTPTDYMSPLMRAAKAGRVDEVRRLLESGADVNEKLRGVTFTALILAVMGGHVEVVKLLLKSGADPNASFGVAHAGFFTPLNMAVRSELKNRLELIDILVAGGALLNPPPQFDESPLMAAVSMSDIEMIKALLKRGSDVNWEDDFGNTALANAVTDGNRTANVVRVLLEAGADPNKPILWAGDNCLSILSFLDDPIYMSRDKVAKGIRRLIVHAGGKKHTRESHGKPCKPW